SWTPRPAWRRRPPPQHRRRVLSARSTHARPGPAPSASTRISCPAAWTAAPRTNRARRSRATAPRRSTTGRRRWAWSCRSPSTSSPRPPPAAPNTGRAEMFIQTQRLAVDQHEATKTTKTHEERPRLLFVRLRVLCGFVLYPRQATGAGQTLVIFALVLGLFF